MIYLSKMQEIEFEILLFLYSPPTIVPNH